MKELTEPQAKLHAYLCERWQNPPTFQEIADHFGFGSKNAVMGHIKALTKKGYIKRPDAQRSRSIELLIGPDLDGTEIEIAGRTYRLIKEKDSVNPQPAR